MRTPEEELERIPVKYKNMYERAFGLNGKKKSRAFAVKAMCYSCVGYEHTYDAIGKCAVFECPLHPYRPIKHQNPPASGRQANRTEK